MIKGPLIVNAMPCHIPFIAGSIREADKSELWAAACLSPEAALWKSLSSSSMAWTGLYDSLPVCMFGVASGSELAGVGLPWMIGTQELDRLAITFLRRNKSKIQEMLDIYPRLMNYVDDRNKKAIRWLKWLGFIIGEPVPFGPFNMPFRPFEMGI
jgi:hypothetical protein